MKNLDDDFPPVATQKEPDRKPNTALWKAAFVTDPSAVKQITGKQYKGNSPKPYWITQRATEIFGPCGIGWGLEVLNERFERLTDTDVLHVALIRIWYEFDGKRGSVEQMGQTKACYKTSGGTMLVDEDAPKKSVTDGMVKCLSMLGFAGDIFSGRWDDSKYVAEAAAETKRRTNAENPLPPYPEESIDENLETWKTAINDGKTTPEKIIAIVSSKFTLSDAQREQIEALATQDDAAEPTQSAPKQYRASGAGVKEEAYDKLTTGERVFVDDLADEVALNHGDGATSALLVAQITEALNKYTADGKSDRHELKLALWWRLLSNVRSFIDSKEKGIRAGEKRKDDPVRAAA